MGNGEISRYEQFLLFPQCFQKTFPADTYFKNQGLFGKEFIDSVMFADCIDSDQTAKNGEIFFLEQNNFEKGLLEVLPIGNKGFLIPFMCYPLYINLVGIIIISCHIYYILYVFML